MKIIILAAGKGERLMPLTKNTPKPLLDMGDGTTLLENQIERLKESGVVNEVVLVIGYLADQIEAKIRMHNDNGFKIRTIFNPLYEVSNNLVSLWAAKHEMQNDFMITNGDNLFTPDVFSGLAANVNEGVYVSVSHKQDFDEDDMKVTLQNNMITSISKKIPIDLSDAESPGLALIRGERMCRIFREHLDLSLKVQGSIQTYWLEVFNCLHRSGIPIRPWFFNSSDRWLEVDFHMDVSTVRELLSLKKNNMI